MVCAIELVVYWWVFHCDRNQAREEAQSGPQRWNRTPVTYQSQAVRYLTLYQSRLECRRDPPTPPPRELALPVLC